MSKDVRIPGDIMKLISVDAVIDNREIIVQYLLSEEGSIQLTQKQQELLERWRKADELMRSGKYTSTEIPIMLLKIFEYKGIATAQRDIYDAQYVFGSTMKPNRAYLLINHINRIEAAMLFYLKHGKDKAYAALSKVLLDAIAKLPDDSKHDPTPAMIVFNFQANNATGLMTQDMDEEKAFAIAGQVLKREELDPDDFKLKDDV